MVLKGEAVFSKRSLKLGTRGIIFKSKMSPSVSEVGNAHPSCQLLCKSSPKIYIYSPENMIWFSKLLQMLCLCGKDYWKSSCWFNNKRILFWIQFHVLKNCFICCTYICIKSVHFSNCANIYNFMTGFVYAELISSL